MSTVITLAAGTDQFCSIGFAPDKAEFTRTKLFNRMVLPAGLNGKTAKSAILSTFSEDGTVALTLPIYSTGDYWDGSSTYIDLEALSLSSQLDSKSVEIVGNWTHFNVLGDVSGGKYGVYQALKDALSSLTFVWTYAGTPTSRTEISSIGNVSGSGDFRLFGYPGDGESPPHYTYLTVELEDHLPVPSSVGTSMMF